MRILFISILLFIQFGLFGAQGAKREVSDSIQIQLNKLKSILLSGEWEPVNQNQLSRIKELISYIENSPIDSVVMELRTDLDTTQHFIKRELRNVTEVANIDGYIKSWEINNSIINIEKTVAEEFPVESIMVPEDQFVGMYANLPLITYGNMSRLIHDSIVSVPDSIILSLADAQLSHSTQEQNEADSLLTAFLDHERKIYNNKLIAAYRDSVTLEYRKSFIAEIIDQRKKQYIDSISKHNLQVLKFYNDSITKVKNLEFANELSSLVTYVHRMPYEITVFNLYNEATKLALHNDDIWYQWIWLKNAQNDSIGLRVENLDRHHFRILVEDAVSWSRLQQRGSLEVNKIQQVGSIDQKLLKVNNRNPKLSPWKLAGKIYSGFTQTYINNYWSKGGNSSASVLNTFDYDANYSKGKVKFENGLDAKLGLIYYLPDEGTTAYRNWHKNSDNFEINSRLGYSAFKEWYYSAEANFKTQFFLGYKNNKDSIPNSSMFSPAYLTFSGGFDYKPSKDFSAFLSPLSVKTTYVTNPAVNETVFGLTEGQTRKTRIGMSGKFELSKNIMENISMRTKNSIFINYGVNNTGEWQLVKVPDFDSETTINFKINQFISTQINLHFIYDKDVTSKWTDSAGLNQSGTKLQVKEFVTFGISYKI